MEPTPNPPKIQRLPLVSIQLPAAPQLPRPLGLRERFQQQGTQRAVHPWLIGGTASAHPCPLAGGRIELPKVIEIAIIGELRPYPQPPKSQKLPATVGPGVSGRAATGHISGSGRPLCTVRTHATGVGPSDPDPQIGRRIELPKVIQIVEITVVVQAEPPKEPEVTAGISPTGRTRAAARNVSRPPACPACHRRRLGRRKCFHSSTPIRPPSAG